MVRSYYYSILDVNVVHGPQQAVCRVREHCLHPALLDLELDIVQHATSCDNMMAVWNDMHNYTITICNIFKIRGSTRASFGPLPCTLFKNVRKMVTFTSDLAAPFHCSLLRFDSRRIFGVLLAVLRTANFIRRSIRRILE
jgi:hypothetical protein